MQLFFRGIKLLKAFVYVGCLVMLIIQIVLSCKDYFSYKSVPTIQNTKVQDIAFPHIFICHKKGFNMSGQQFTRLSLGIKITFGSRFY